MNADNDRNELVRSAAPPGVAVECAPLYLPGPWDALILPAQTFFSSPEIRKSTPGVLVMVYGPAHLFRSAWLLGVHDYLREPWSEEELFLRLRGPLPSVSKWTWESCNFTLEGQELWVKDGNSINLSAAEALILGLLVQRKGLAVARNILAWEAGCSPGRVVDTLISRLRTKVQEASGSKADPILSVRGIGYRVP